MSYTKHTWDCGESITAEKLNHLEDGVEQANECCGYECATTLETVFDGSITTVDQGSVRVGQFTVSQAVNSDSIQTTLNGMRYELPRGEFNGQVYYGEFNNGFVFTTYPCAIVIDGSQSMLFTENEGTYTVLIETTDETVTTTSCFRNAVRSLLQRTIVTFSQDGSYNITQVSHSAQEIYGKLSDDEEIVLKLVDSDGNYTRFYLREYQTALDVDDNNHTTGKGYRFVTTPIKSNNALVATSVWYMDVVEVNGTYYWVYQQRYSGKHE